MKKQQESKKRPFFWEGVGALMIGEAIIKEFEESLTEEELNEWVKGEK